MSEVPDPSGNWFVAFPAVVEAPGGLDALLDGAPGILRRFHPADLHLTLAFFGRLEPERLAAVQGAVNRLDVAATDAEATAFQLFPSPRRPSVIALTLGRGNDFLADAISRWRPVLLAAAGRPADPRPPRPHLTVARLPRRLSASALKSLRRWIPSIDPIPLAIAAPRLYGWSPERPAGPVDPSAPPPRRFAMMDIQDR